MSGNDRPVHEQVLEARRAVERETEAVRDRTAVGCTMLGDDEGWVNAVCYEIDLNVDAAPVLARQVQAALALHEAVYSQSREVCFCCRTPYPCSTVRALTEVSE